jgi:hypothetical protein
MSRFKGEEATGQKDMVRTCSTHAGGEDRGHLMCEIWDWIQLAQSGVLGLPIDLEVGGSMYFRNIC